MYSFETEVTAHKMQSPYKLPWRKIVFLPKKPFAQSSAGLPTESTIIFFVEITTKRKIRKSLTRKSMTPSGKKRIVEIKVSKAILEFPVKSIKTKKSKIKANT